MEGYKIDEKKFKFQYLPAYADYLLNNKLEEFVLIGIRFCRELDLPMLKPLARLSEQELVAISLDSNRQRLQRLIDGTIYELIEANLNKWIQNKLGFIDQDEITPEDLTLVYYIRRKQFSYFLYSYTQSAAIQQLIIDEVDSYTSNEELLALKAYFDIHRHSNGLTA